MLKVTKGTWHYWFYKQGWFGDPPETTNLCCYVNRFLIGLAKWPVLVALSPIIAFFWLICYEIRGLPVLFWMLLGSITVFLGWGDVFWFRHSTTSAVFAHGALAVLVGSIFLIGYLSEADSAKLFRAWISAKHQKVCPLITFVEKDSQ